MADFSIKLDLTETSRPCLRSNLFPDISMKTGLISIICLNLEGELPPSPVTIVLDSLSNK